MPISIVTNVNSLMAQNNMRMNSDFQSRTIGRLTSGYRINSSGDDAAGLAVANKFRSDTAELTQGSRNANDGVSQLQIMDGGLSNISTMLDRLKTLATQSASTTFTGDRSTLNSEYKAVLSEIDRQAANVGLDQGGTFNKNISVYTGGGGATQSNSQVSIDLSGTANVATSAGLNLNTTDLAAAGTTLSGAVNLENAAGNFSGPSTFTFHIVNSSTGALTTAAAVYDGTATTGQGGVDKLNGQLSSLGITASISKNGNLQFGSGAAFSVLATSAANGLVANNDKADVNTGLNSLSPTTAFTAVTVSPEVDVVTTAKGAVSLTFGVSTSTADLAVANINSNLASIGVTAVTDSSGVKLSLQSSSSFTVNTITVAGAGNVLGTVLGSQATTAASTSDGTDALSALNSITAAVKTLGQIQGRIGSGQNKLQYAINLAQSQISNFSAAESRIRDADVAAEASNLTKAQVLQQASIAAMAQANSAPQAILALLR